MVGLLQFLLTLFLVVVLTVAILGYSLIRKVTGFFSNNRTEKQNHNRTSAPDSSYQKEKSRKKIIGDDEGEYVDYEEIEEG